VVERWESQGAISQPLSPSTSRSTCTRKMQAHSARSERVNDNGHSRPTAQDLHSPPPHAVASSRGDRRASPSYDQYDRPPHNGDQHHSSNRDREEGGRPRWTEEEREQRAIEREERRGGGRERLTPERELGYSGRYGQQAQGGYGGQQDRGGYQGGGGERNGYGRGGGGGRGDDWLDS